MTTDPTPKSIHRRGFRARELEFSRRSLFESHAHRGGHLVLVFEGEWMDRAGLRRRRLRRGDALFHPGPFEHETQAAAGTSVVLIDISHAALGTFCSVYGNRLRPMHATFDGVEGIPERIRAEIARADEAATLIAHSLVLQLLAVGSRAPLAPAQRKPDWIAPLLEYIHANLGERLTIGRLAEVAAVSESHLSHSFARHLDCSVSEYIRDCRLRGAARALRRMHDSIQQIAWNFGFSDQAHFARTFKSAYGVTPTEYRSARMAWDEALWIERASADFPA